MKQLHAFSIACTFMVISGTGQGSQQRGLPEESTYQSGINSDDPEDGENITRKGNRCSKDGAGRKAKEMNS